jgi:gliding motility-associated-like protein
MLNIFCEGNTTTLDAGATYAQYIWSTGDATQTATFNASDPNVTVTVTDSFGCIGTAATSVTQRLNPTPNISGSTSFCQGFSTTLDAGTGYAQYTWSTGDATQTATFNTSDPNVVVTVTDNFGCIGTANTSVSESTGLSPTITGNTDFCQGTSTTLTADSGYTTYNWSTGGTGTSVTLNASDPNIILTVTDATGCSGTATTAVTQHPNPTPNISGNIDFCEGNTTTLDAGATYAQYIWSTGDDTQTASFNTSDPNVTVTVTDSFGCIGTDNTSVTQHLNPTPNISGSTSFCEGFSTTLDAGTGYAQYTWSTGDATQTILVDEPIANLQLSVTDNFGCIGTANTSVSENTSLSPTITGNTNFCEGSTTTLTADSGYTNYNWSTGGTGTSVTLNASDPNITLTVTDATGCSGTATAAVTQHLNPTPNISGNIDFCEGNTTTLDAGATYAQYIWSTGDATQMATFNASDPNIIVTVTDSFGCIGTDNTSVTQHLNPTPNISGSTSFCEGFSTTLDAGAGYAQYTWSTGDATQTILVDEPIANLQLSVTDNFGCIGTANTSVSENTSLSPTITGNTNFCEGSTTTLTADSGYTNYNWSTGGTGTSVTLNASDPNITLTVTDATGCSGTATAAVTQHLNPTPNISGNIDFCEGNTTTLDAGAGYITYLWSTGDATQMATFNASDPNIIVTVTDSFGCIGTAATSVTQHLNPTPNITGSISFCEGFSTTLDAGAGYAQYTWSTGDATQTILVDEPIANLQLSVTDNFGCIGTANTSVSENTSLSPTITGNTDFCEGSTTTLTADSGYTNYNWSTGGTGTSVTLNASNPNIILTVTDATGCSGTATAAVTQHLNPTPNISGALSFCTDGFTTLSSTGYNNYLWSTGEITESATITTPGTVSLTVTDANGCVGSQQTTVTEQAYLTPTITGNTDFCEGNTASIAAETGYTSYIWTTGNTNNQVIIDEGGIYSVTVSDANGCTGIGTTNVVMHPNPDPSISGNLSFAETSSTVLSAVGGNYNSYAWSSGSTEASIEVNNGGIYIVAVSDANGCTGSAAAIVNEQAIFDILIPNAFSPNNDGVNDVFRIVGLHIQNTKILISDRWGREVYNSTDTKQGWDGTTNGIEREMGVYAYTVWVKLDNGREKMYHGNVTLMR